MRTLYNLAALICLDKYLTFPYMGLLPNRLCDENLPRKDLFFWIILKGSVAKYAFVLILSVYF